GYELEVAADVDGKPATRLRMPPGKVPDLRLRVGPVLAAPSQPVTAQLIRGPQFTGTLPAKLAIDCPTHPTASGNGVPEVPTSAIPTARAMAAPPGQPSGQPPGQPIE